MTRARTFGRSVMLLASTLIVSACTVTKTSQYAIEVKRGGTIAEKVAIAKAIVTEDRVVRLRQELKARLPGVTDQQLARLGLRWNEIRFQSLGDGKSGTTVTVAVGIQIDGSFDPQPIIDASVALLEPEINSSQRHRQVWRMHLRRPTRSGRGPVSHDIRNGASQSGAT